MYSGRIESGDSLMLFDATSSLFRFGDWLLDESAVPLEDRHIGKGLETYRGERLQAILALPLYAFAWIVPGVGLVQTTWIFNIIVTLALVAVFFMFSRQLGYNYTVSVFASLLLGSSTIFLPYTKSFFREPLVALFLLWIAFSFEKTRKARSDISLSWVVCGLVFFGFAIQIKQSALLAIPGLACLLLLDRNILGKPIHLHQITKFLLDAIFVALVLFTLASCFVDLANPLSRIFTSLESLNFPVPRQDWHFFRTAMASQILSPGGSFWGSSPILLLAVPGAYSLWRNGARRHLWAAALLVICYSIGHAVRGPHWFGGLSWPPRFLLPTLPFVMILSLPALEGIFQHRRRLSIFITGILVAYSLLWQFSSVVFRWDKLPLPDQANGLLEWSGGLFSPRYLRPILTIPKLGEVEWDFAWVRSNAILLPIMYFVLASMCIFFMRKLLCKQSNLGNPPQQRVVFLPVTSFALLVASLFFVARDPIYSPNPEALWEMIPILDEATESGDIVFVTQKYRDFLLNHGASRNPRYIMLTYQPGESYHPEIAASVASESPRFNLDRYTAFRLNIMFSELDGFFFLSDAGPFLPWRPRVLERYFAERAYPIREISTAPDVRLLEYDLAPLPTQYQEAELISTVRFGEDLQLIGIMLPDGAVYSPGETIPLASEWQARSSLSTDFTISWKLARDGRVFTSSMDWEPSAGLNPTSSWEVAYPYWDLRGIRLPKDIPDGDYELWLIAYYFADEKLRHLPVTGGETLDGYISILPATIRVQADAQ